MENETTESQGPPPMPEARSATPYVVQAQQAYVPMVPEQGNLHQVSQNDRTMGMLVHLLGLLTGLIGILILWLIKKDESRFVDFHSKEAINFQLSIFIVVLVLMGFGIVTLGIGMIIAAPVIAVIAIGATVLEIIACVSANRGEWHRYPLSIRFIK